MPGAQPREGVALGVLVCFCTGPLPSIQCHCTLWVAARGAGRTRDTIETNHLSGEGLAMASDRETITFADFLKVDIRVGTVVRAEPYPEARRPAAKLWVDFGPQLGVKKTSAQVVERYALDALPGRQVAAVVNFPPKQIGKFMSEILVLGFPDEDGEVILVGPDREVPNGGRLY